MGVALSPCTVPAAGQPGFTLGETRSSWAWASTASPASAAGRSSRPTPWSIACSTPSSPTCARRPDRPRSSLLVNNLGGTPTMELAIVARRAVAALEGRGLAVERAYLGTFLSALEMAGVSLSVLPRRRRAAGAARRADRRPGLAQRRGPPATRTRRPADADGPAAPARRRRRRRRRRRPGRCERGDPRGDGEP